MTVAPADSGSTWLTRLVGDGSDEMSGGGLPLPDAFRAILQYLLDEKEQGRTLIPEDPLIRKVRDALVLRHRRVLAIWASWDALTEDLLVPLEAKQLVICERTPDGRRYWRLADTFTPGKRYTVIDSPRVRVSAMGHAERERQNEIAKMIFVIRETEATLKKKRYLDETIRQRFAALYAALEAEPEPKEDDSVLLDEPQAVVVCAGCSKPYPKTRQHFDVVQLKGRWHWTGRCLDCLHIQREEQVRERGRRIDSALLSIHAEGRVITIPEVMERAGLKDQRRIIQSWRRLAGRQLIPLCPLTHDGRPDPKYREAVS